VAEVPRFAAEASQQLILKPRLVEQPAQAEQEEALRARAAWAEERSSAAQGAQQEKQI